MARFMISLPGGRMWSGESAGAFFKDGKAEVDASTPKGRSQVGYFHGAGYDVKPLDDVSVQHVLSEQHDDSRTALDEATALKREIAELKAAKELEDLRKERDELYREVHGRDRDEDAPATPSFKPHREVFTVGSVDEPAAPAPAPAAQRGEGSKLPPPQDNAPVAEWREWAVASKRASEEEVASMPRADIIRTHGKAYDTERAAELDKEATA